MAGLIQRFQALWRRLAGSPAIWLYASQLLARGYGFGATLVIARLCGPASVGSYSALLITCSSPTAPMALALANSATLQATDHGRAWGMSRLLRANQWGLWLSALAAGLGALLLLQVSGLDHVGGMSVGFQVGAVLGLIAGMLLGPVVMGMAHGMGLSTEAAKLVCAVQVMGILALYPMVLAWGVPAALVVTVLITLAPIAVLTLGRGSQAHPPDASTWASLRTDACQRLKQALPNVLSTVLNNATNWLACIYLAGKYHGHEGVALVAISLQWLALVQMPVSSYSGRLMYDLGLAHQQGRGALHAAANKAKWACVGITLAMMLAVGLISPWIADLYRIDRESFIPLLILGGGGAILSGFTLVYERVFFCLKSQRPWLLFSTLAFLLQLALTFTLIPHTLLAVPLGNALGMGLLALSVGAYLKRTAFRTREAL